MRVTAFRGFESHSYFIGLEKKLKGEMIAKGKSYILNVDELTFKNYLVQSNTLTPLQIDFGQSEISEYVDKQGGRYHLRVAYQFSGSPELFQVEPRESWQTFEQIDIDGLKQTVSIFVQVEGMNSEVFKKEEVRVRSQAFMNLASINKDAQVWNQKLPAVVEREFTALKNEYSQEREFFKAINVRINPDTSLVFTPPVIKKIHIPQPPISHDEPFELDPALPSVIYEDIINVIYAVGKSMEKKPSLYIGKHETDLRDLFLLFLETRYVSITATGETFNKKGKTDIILKYAYAKGTGNVFVAECKVWGGPASFQEAITQLLGYLTWRDSKTALILFVDNREFSKTLESIQAEVKKHPQFDRPNGKHGESSFSYEFRLPQDKDKKILMEVIAFHFEERKSPSN